MNQWLNWLPLRLRGFFFYQILHVTDGMKSIVVYITFGAHLTGRPATHDNNSIKGARSTNKLFPSPAQRTDQPPNSLRRTVTVSCYNLARIPNHLRYFVADRDLRHVGSRSPFYCSVMDLPAVTFPPPRRNFPFYVQCVSTFRFATMERLTQDLVFWL